MKREQRVINNQFESIKNVPHYRALNGMVNIGNEGINGTNSINLMTSLHIIIYSCFNKFVEICSAVKTKNFDIRLQLCIAHTKLLSIENGGKFLSCDESLKQFLK
jgi:hypothetical protein